MTTERISRRVGAITESATLAVDARAKALKAAGEPVIGFGAGEPDFATPDHIVEAAVVACRDPKNHRYSPAGGLPELKDAIVGQDPSGLGLRGAPRPGAGHQRRQARRLQHLRGPAQPGRRGPAAGAVLDDLPRTDRPRRRHVGRPPHRRVHRLPGHRRAARSGPHACHQGAGVRLAVEPDRCGLPRGRGAGHRRVGRRARHLGRHRRDLRAPHLRRPHVPLDADAGARAGRHLRRAQRRGQDLRHDRLAGRLDDRSGRRDQGRHQPPVALHLQRGQRVASGPPWPRSPATSTPWP